MRTLSAALAATLYSGMIVMLAGEYVNESLSLATTKDLTIRTQGEVNVLLGEKVDAFTNHSGNTWKADISTAIPEDRAFNSANDFLAFVFEWETPEGAITNPLPLQQGRAHRLDHYRLRWGGSRDTLAAGEFWYQQMKTLVSITLSNPGSGYQTGDYADLTFAGSDGTDDTKARVTVTTVNGSGAITGITITTAGRFIATSGSVLATLFTTAGGAGVVWNAGTLANATTSRLFLHRTDSSDPNGHDYWIPDQSGKSFVHSGTQATNISISGVRVFFGKNGFDLSGVATYSLTDIMAFGNANEGVLFSNGPTTGTELRCEYAANANDGRGCTATAGNEVVATVTDAWAHDNGDEGVSDHQEGSIITYVNPLLENNASSGSTWVQGAVVIFTNPHTRENPIGLSASINTRGGSITGWLSERDTIAASATSASTITFSSSTITGPTQWALYAGAVGDIVNATNTAGVTTPRAGGGTFNVT